MEATNSLIYSQFPPRTHLKQRSSSSVLMLYEKAAPAVLSLPTAPLAQQYPPSVLMQDLKDDSRTLTQINKTPQAVLNERDMEAGIPFQVEFDPVNADKYLQQFESQLLHWQGLWYLSPSLQMGRIPSLPSSKQSVARKTKKQSSVEPFDVVSLAKSALLASRCAASLTKDYKSSEANIYESLTQSSSGSTTLPDFPVEQERIVRSTRILERRSRKRRVPKQEDMVQETSNSKNRSKLKRSDPDDPLRLFLWAPETKQLLTAKEESELIVSIQELMTLEEVKGRLHAQFGREPTVVEWAESVGLSCRALKSQIHHSNKSREKLIYANFRLVVHIAKQYQGRGLNLQDLLQEGSMGLMRSVQKFKPQAGCRFATYAFWWIRHAVRKAIFQHSRTIRLPDNVYELLYKVTEAKRQCIQDGHHRPTKEQISARAGITVDKLERLLYSVRTPLSLQQPVWTDQNTTFQQITADPTNGTDSVEKQLMRRHIRNLLSVLSPKERKIMQLRYGFEGGKPKSLSEIGAVFGLSKERVRQLESRALYKLRQRLSSEGLNAYEDFLV